MQHHLTRRHTVAMALSLATLLMAPTAWTEAQAQASYPTKAIRLVNNFPPGGPADTLARSIQPVLQEALKQPVIVDSKSGAAGNIGASEVARSTPDGHTLLIGIDTTFTINPHIYKSMPFKPADLKPVVIMASSGLMVGVHPSAGIKSMKQLLEAGKTRSFNFSSAGSGSPGHLSVEMFHDAANLKLNHIPYRGNTPAVTAIVAGEVDGGSLATPGMVPHTQSGRITPLAVTSTKRSRIAPDVPTVAELGLKELEQEILYLVMAPAATPDAVVKTLEKAILEALQRPEVAQRLQSLDLHFEGTGTAAATKRLADMSVRYAKTIAATGMKVE